MPVLTRRKLKAGNLAQWLGLPECVVYRWGAQLLDTGHESVCIPWRSLAVHPGDSDNPALPFYGQEQCAKIALWDLGQAKHAFPILRGNLGHGKDGSSIGKVDADGVFYRQRPADRLEQAECQRPTPRGVNNQVRL